MKDSNNVPIDIRLKEYLCFPRGFFIDIGAHDGVSQNNTKIFEELYGWKGMLIEPSIQCIDKMKINRPNTIIENYALVGDERKQISGDFNGHLMASENGKRLKKKKITSVNSCRLDELIEKQQIKRIDFICIDTNGTELEVLKGINLHKYTPKYILIQIIKDKYEIICNLLSNNNYRLLCNLTNYNKKQNPRWNGLHNDYLFEYLY